MVYVGMTLLLGFAAVNTGNNLLYLLVSALLGFMAVSGWFGQQNLRRLRVEINLPQEVFARQQTLVGVRIHNQRRRLPAFLIRLKLGQAPPLFTLIPAGDSCERSLMLSWPERGRQQIGDLWVDSCFPINFFIRAIRIPVDQELLVFPAPLSGKPPQAEGETPQRLQQASATSGDSGDLRSIHDYRGGEPLKSIHWKLSARHDQFKVRQHEGLGAQPVVIDLEGFEGSLEQRLRQATWLIIDQLRRQRPVGLRLSEALIPPGTGFGQRRRLLTELALYHGR